MYEYRASVLKVVDGDTIHAELDLGIDVRITLKLRLAGIDAPEMRTAEGPPARQHLVDLLGWPNAGTPGGNQITVRTIKDSQEKYGRYLAFVLVGSRPVSVNDQMVLDGYAMAYNP